MTHVRARYRKQGAHYHITVFVGEREDLTHANAGTLVLNEREFIDFKQNGIDQWVMPDDETPRK